MAGFPSYSTSCLGVDQAGTVFVTITGIGVTGMTNCELIAIGGSGQELWCVKGLEQATDMVVQHDRIHLATIGGLYCYDTTGKKQWVSHIGWLSQIAVAESGITYYRKESSTEVCALDSEGNILWKQDCGLQSAVVSVATSGPVVAGDQVLVGTGDLLPPPPPSRIQSLLLRLGLRAFTLIRHSNEQGRLMALDPTTGSILWSNTVNEQLSGGLDVDTEAGRCAAYACGQYSIYAFSAD